MLEAAGIPDKPHDPAFEPLVSFLRQVPGVEPHIGSGYSDAGKWWVKFVIDIKHPLAWRVVQEMGHVLNYVSVEERLPTVFKPVSPPPYMNGGPEDFLSWLIDTRDAAFTPADAAEWLEGRLPRPVTDLKEWDLDDDEDDDDEDD